MVKIAITAPLDGLRGTLGGVTYSANASGPYARRWTRPTVAPTLKLTEIKGQLSTLPSQWRAMTAALRADWNTFAALAAQEQTDSLGNAYYLSGFNWFLKTNLRRLRLARAVNTAVPTQARPSAPTITDFRVTPAGTRTDIATGGTASASTYNASYPPSYAFDNVLSEPQSWRTAAGNPTGWLQYILSSSAIVRAYSISFYGGASRYPVAWTFERLDAGPTWTPIDTITGESFAFGETKLFFCSNETSSTTYRLNVTQNGGDPGVLYVTELDMFTAIKDSSVVIYPEDEFVAATNYDLVLHIAQSQSPAVFAAPNNWREIYVTTAPGRTYANFQDELEALVTTINYDRSWFAALTRQTQEGLRSPWSNASCVTLE